MVWERQRRASPRGGVAPAQPARLERAQSHVRSDGRVHVPGVGGMVMSGRGRHGRNGLSPVGHRRGSSTCSASGRLPAGRSFRPTTAERSNVVVLSEAFWRTRFDADPSVVGRDIRLDGDALHGRRRRAGGGFSCSAGPASGRSSPSVAHRPPRDARYVLRVIGRMKPGVTLDAARLDMTAVADGLAREFPADQHRAAASCSSRCTTR